LGGELIEVDTAITIVVKFIKKFVNDLRPMLIINTLFGKESIHLLSVDFTISIGVNLSEFCSETLLFLLLTGVNVPR